AAWCRSRSRSWRTPFRRRSAARPSRCSASPSWWRRWSGRPRRLARTTGSQSAANNLYRGRTPNWQTVVKDLPTLELPAEPFENGLVELAGGSAAGNPFCLTLRLLRPLIETVCDEHGVDPHLNDLLAKGRFLAGSEHPCRAGRHLAYHPCLLESLLCCVLG